MTDANLIAELESATEGSRELDLKIIDVLKLGSVMLFASAGADWYDLGAIEHSLTTSGRHVPHYTTSIDAALTPIESDAERYQVIMDALEQVALHSWRPDHFGEDLARYICIEWLKARDVTVDVSAIDADTTALPGEQS